MPLYAVIIYTCSCVYVGVRYFSWQGSISKELSTTVSEQFVGCLGQVALTAPQIFAYYCDRVYVLGTFYD